MSSKGLELQRSVPLNKKVREFFWGSWQMEVMWNYENQQGASFMRGLSKTLDRLYCEPDEVEKRKERYRAADEFYNSTPQMGAFILGVTAAMEEEYAAHPDEFDPKVISSVKTTLMGPLAGVGDAIIPGTIRPIAMSIGIALAQQGSILGPIIAMVISFVTSFSITWFGAKFGYTKGSELIKEISENNMFDKVMYGCSIAGLIIVGGMTATLVSITTPLAMVEALVLQTLLDGIMPCLLQLVGVLIMYRVVKKGWHPVIVVLACLVLGVVFKWLGILTA